MANPKHLEILKQGMEVWNQWRKNNEIKVDLRNADLHDADLRHTNLSGVNLKYAELYGSYLYRAMLHRSDLSRADLNSTDLSNAILSGALLTDISLHHANLSHADLSRADLSDADLHDAGLSHADLRRVNFHDANLSNADLSNAQLSGAIFSGANLNGANFSKATLGWTIFGSNDLSIIKGLDTVIHQGPSTVGIDSIYHSQGNIPEVFLRGAGVPDIFITFMRSLIANPIQFYSCFISYSSKDQHFTERLYADLQAIGVRCWFAPEDLRIGDKVRDRIDESIKLRDKLLLVLSGHSIASNWVEHEVESALEEERQSGRTILFPIRLDNAVLETSKAWAALIRRTRHIGDFTHWKDHDSYQRTFDRLLCALRTEETKG